VAARLVQLGALRRRDHDGEAVSALRIVRLPVRRVLAVARLVLLAAGAVLVVLLVATGDQPRPVPLTPVPAPAATTWTTTTVTVPAVTAPEETI
jgi:hypothetical protein